MKSPHVVFVLAIAVAALSACAPETPVPAAQTTSAPAAAEPAAAQAPAVAAATAEDPNAWMRSELWRATLPCLAQAQMIYDQVGGRLRGRTIEEQMDDYAAREDLGPDKTAMLVKIRAQLEKLYAAPENVATTLGAGVAAECIGASPQTGIDKVSAHQCFQQFVNPVMQRAYVDAAPPQAELAQEANHRFYLCLRGETP